MDAYTRWGHLTEDGVEILYYDARCCHVDGVCERAQRIDPHSPQPMPPL
jgi:hypothetical protein